MDLMISGWDPWMDLRWSKTLQLNSSEPANKILSGGSPERTEKGLVLESEASPIECHRRGNRKQETMLGQMRQFHEGMILRSKTPLVKHPSISKLNRSEESVAVDDS
jgi:hypothetical protein